MGIVLLLILALLPGLILLYFIRFMDRSEKEPLGLVLKIMILGAFSIVPVAFIEYFMELLPIYGGGKILNALTTSFIQIAWVEELAKLAVVLLVAWNNENFNEENDGIVYVGASALGFAMLENVFFVLSRGVMTGVLRSITAMPLHCFSGVIMGYYVGKARFSTSGKEAKKHIIKGFFLAFMLHGIYDALLLTHTPAALLIFPLLIGLIIFSIRIMKKSRAPARTAEALSEADALAQQRAFLQANPKKQQWKIVLSRILFALCGLSWILLITGLIANAGKYSFRAIDAVIGGIIFSFFPLLIGVLLEISYRQHRAYYNKKKEHFPEISETVSREDVPPPGYFWQVIAARTLLILSALFWIILVLMLMTGSGEEAIQGYEVLLGGTIVSFFPIYIGVTLEISYRKRKKIYNNLLKKKPEENISAEDLRLSPPGHLWRIVVSRVLLAGGGLFWLLFIFETLSRSEKVVSAIAGDFLVVLLITVTPLVAGVMLDISYRKIKKATALAREAAPQIPPAHDPTIPVKSDEELHEYTRKLKGSRDRDRFYYKKRE